jgi:hypothetical protein
MSGSLVTLPLRLSVRVAELTFTGAQEVVRRVAGLTGLRGPGPSAEPSSEPASQRAPSAERRAPESSNGAGRTPTETAPRDPRSAAAETEAPPPAPPPVVDAEVVEAEPAVDYDAPPEPEPVHIDEEVELVQEVAEPGAEDGAGAQIRIDEPWDGYRELRAADVVDRLGGASVAELGAVELYELSTRKRSTILSAVQRELRRRG